MATGRGWGGASRAGSNHPALACTSAAPPYPRGILSPTYVAVSRISPFACAQVYFPPTIGAGIGLAFALCCLLTS